MYVLDIDVTRNGNNLKLKVKFEFSLSMGLMVINHSNPYIHSTTVRDFLSDVHLSDLYVDAQYVRPTAHAQTPCDTCDNKFAYGARNLHMARAFGWNHMARAFGWN